MLSTFSLEFLASTVLSTFSLDTIFKFLASTVLVIVDLCKTSTLRFVNLKTLVALRAIPNPSTYL